MVPIKYTSADASAPVINGVADSYRQALKAILCDGYGAKAAAGWTEAHSGTNKAAFRQGVGPVGSTQAYFRVDDSGPGAGTHKEGRIRGFGAMTDVDTGTDPFPTVAQMANGGFFRKSTTADATARAWKCWATHRSFIMLIATGDTANTWYPIVFADSYSWTASDAYRQILLARGTENVATADTIDQLAADIGTAQAGQYIMRSDTGLGSSVNIGKHGNKAWNSIAATMAGGGMTSGAINRSGANVPLYPVHIHHDTYIRGIIPFLYCTAVTAAAVADGNTIDGIGDQTGKTFEIVKSTPTSGGIMIVLTSDWPDSP
jgi:hypothetical protein